MSLQALSWALEQQIVTDPAARFVLLIFANYAGADGTTSHPSNKTIRRLTGLPERTIRRKTRVLQEKGLLLPGDQVKAIKNSDRLDRVPRCYDLPIYPRGVTMAPGKHHGGPKMGVRGAKTGGHGGPQLGPRSVNRTVNEPAREKKESVHNPGFMAGLKQLSEHIKKVKP